MTRKKMWNFIFKSFRFQDPGAAENTKNQLKYRRMVCISLSNKSQQFAAIRDCFEL